MLTWKDVKEKKTLKKKKHESKKDAKEKKLAWTGFFIIMAYWINIGSRGRQ